MIRWVLLKSCPDTLLVVIVSLFCVLYKVGSRVEIPFSLLVPHPCCSVIIHQVQPGMAGFGQSYILRYLLDKRCSGWCQHVVWSTTASQAGKGGIRQNIWRLNIVRVVVCRIHCESIYCRLLWQSLLFGWPFSLSILRLRRAPKIVHWSTKVFNYCVTKHNKFLSVINRK